jgi:hypothetical protein
VDRESTVAFYTSSFEATETLNVKLLGARMEAGRLLEKGVLADMLGEQSFDRLSQALDELKEARSLMDTLFSQLTEMRNFERTHALLPEDKLALVRILKNHPLVERVSLTNSRFANAGGAGGATVNYGPIGADYDELLGNLIADLKILQVEHDQAIEAFEAILPAARRGGFAAIVLSGRAPLPEEIMRSADQMIVYLQFYNRACMTTIAADMQVYPRGLEWLPKPGSHSE